MPASYNKAKQKAELTKQNIYFSAMQLFSEHGYDNVSVDDIVREAKSSKGTFYNYFRSKDEMFVYYNQALQQRLEDFYTNLCNYKHYSGENGLEKLYIMIMYTLHSLQDSGREFTAIADMRQLRDENAAPQSEDVLCNITADIYQPLLELGKRDGSIDATLDVPNAQLLLYFHLKGIVYRWESSAKSGKLEDEYAELFSRFCQSIAATPAE